MLRVDSEAQLAAVLGHEIGHYLERHSIERLRSAKSSSAVGQFAGMFGVVGLIGAMGLVAGQYAYSRDNERDADRIGLLLMNRAGYDAAEAAKVWEEIAALRSADSLPHQRLAGLYLSKEVNDPEKAAAQLTATDTKKHTTPEKSEEEKSR